MVDLLEHSLIEARLVGCDGAVDRLFEQRRRSLAADTHGAELHDDVLAILHQQCCDHISTVAQHFSEDAVELAAVFGGGLVDGARILDVGLGDAHDGGRSPVLLGVDGGGRFVYKPRSVAGHVVFADILDAVRVVDTSLDLNSLNVLERGDHGWAEFVEPTSCETAHDVATYHRRFGMLLGVSHATGAVDLHHENVIAAGSMPTVIDWETILQPAPHPDGRSSKAAFLRRSVLGTSLLPTLTLGPQGPHDESALGGPDDSPSRCRLGTEPQSPDLWADDIVNGYESMRRAIVEACEALVAPDGVLERHDNLAVRFVIRRTAAYRRLLGAGLALGAKSPIERQAWYRAKLTVAGAEPADVAAAIVQEEAHALARFDIPRFVVAAGATDLRLDGHTFASALPRSAIEQSRERVSEFCTSDSGRQRRIIRLSLAAHAANAATALGPVHPTDVHEATIAPLVHTDLHTEVETIISTILETYQTDVGWLTVRQVAAGRFDTRPASSSFADGALGIACFLLCAANALPSSELTESCRSIASAAIEPLAMAIDGTAPPNSAPLDTGTRPLAAYGAALYGYNANPEWLRRSRTLAITDEPSSVLDIYDGTAGMLLALAAQPAPPERLVGLADDLITRDPAESAGHGLAHGAAGLAMALARVANVTGVQRFADAAVRLVSGLPAARTSNEWTSTWCRGDAGAVLARISVAVDLGARSDDTTIGRLTEGLCGRPLASLDHLCCGELGTIEAIIAAADHLGRQDLRLAGHERLARVLQRRDAHGGWSLLPGSYGNEPVGLLQGLAGVGYGLLRHVAPATPSVLMVRTC